MLSPATRHLSNYLPSCQSRFPPPFFFLFHPIFLAVTRFGSLTIPLLFLSDMGGDCVRVCSFSPRCPFACSVACLRYSVIDIVVGNVVFSPLVVDVGVVVVVLQAAASACSFSSFPLPRSLSSALPPANFLAVFLALSLFFSTAGFPLKGLSSQTGSRCRKSKISGVPMTCREPWSVTLAQFTISLC